MFNKIFLANSIEFLKLSEQIFHSNIHLSLLGKNLSDATSEQKLSSRE